MHNLKNIDVDIPCPDCGGPRYGKEAGLIRRIPKKGGEIVAAGTPEEICESARSKTGVYLKRYTEN